MTESIFHLVSQSGWAFAGFLLFLLAPVLGKAFQEFLKTRVEVKKIEAETQVKRGRLDDSPKAYSETGTARASSVVDSNFDILEKYYNQTLAENRLLYRAAISMALLGFFVIFGLVFSGLTAVGTVSSVAGLLAEAATLLFFNQLREQVKQVKDYHKKLISTQYLMTSIALTKELDGDRHDAEIVRIIRNLLFLSNELHESTSAHLFDRTPLPVDKSNSETTGRIAAPSAPAALASGATPIQPLENSLADPSIEPEQQSPDARPRK
jgi:hypothetical protein